MAAPHFVESKPNTQKNFKTELALINPPVKKKSDSKKSVSADPTFDKKSSKLFFHEGWKQVQMGDLQPGGEVRVYFSLNRLAADGRALGQVESEVSFNGGPPQPLPVRYSGGPPTEVVLKIPEDAKKMELWFRGTELKHDTNDSASDTQAAIYDSRFGQNYTFELA